MADEVAGTAVADAVWVKDESGKFAKFVQTEEVPDSKALGEKRDRLRADLSVLESLSPILAGLSNEQRSEFRNLFLPQLTILKSTEEERLQEKVDRTAQALKEVDAALEKEGVKP
jgi:hypothetical protein